MTIPESITRLPNVSDRELLGAIRFQGLSKEQAITLALGELTRLLEVTKLAETTKSESVTTAAFLEISCLLNDFVGAGFLGEIDTLRKNIEFVAANEVDDLIEGESGRDLQIQFLKGLGLHYIIQRIAPRDSTVVLYKFLSTKEQVDINGRRYLAFEQLPSYLRKQPRISRSIHE